MRAQLAQHERTEEAREPGNSKCNNLAFRFWLVLGMLTISSGYGKRSTERTPTTLRNGKKRKSRKTSRPLMNQGVEVVELHQVEDGGHRTTVGGGEDEALADLLVGLRRSRPLQHRRSQCQHPQIRKKMPRCTLLGKPPRNERSK